MAALGLAGSTDVLSNVGLTTRSAGPAAGDGLPTNARAGDAPAQAFTLDEVAPPAGKGPGPAKTIEFKASKNPFHADQDARNKALGLAGEQLVLQVERQRLLDAGRPDLASAIVHTSVVEGDGAGYDIRSFTEEGEVRHLEVKTTRSGASTAFFVSPNENAFSQENPSTFVLVRVFAYDEATKSGHCYRLPGPIEDSLSLTPTQFRAALLP